MKKWCILIKLLVCFCAFSSDDVLKKDSSEVQVRISIEDALKSNDLAELKKSLFEMQRAIAVLELENKVLREEKDIVYREFIEINEKYQKQNENYHLLQLMLGSIASSGDVRKLTEGKSELMKSISDYSKYGNMLALDSIQFCEFVRSLITELPIGKVRLAELQLKIEALEKSSNKFITLGSTYFDRSNSMGRCRILAVDKRLNCVILSVGTVHGAFNGLIYRSGKEPSLLKVVAVRPYVAAAVLISGNIQDLSPGMEAVSGEIETTKNNREPDYGS